MFTDVAAQVKLPKLIGDSMILQRDAKLKIWGWAAAKEKVTIHFNNKTYNTITAQDGMWMITLMPMHAGGPYDMQIDAGNRIIIKNILIGDVWVCSGQSNMEMPMQRLQDKYPEIIAAANNRNIRQFNVSTKYNFQSAQEDLASGSWQTATPQSVLQFTAVGYFFAKTLYEKYHVPVGLIKSAVGGSPAEAWLSADALKQFPSYLHKIDTLRNQSYVDSVIQHDNANSNTWYNN
ncbi:MAG TPA: sialate O-acetylesterase, partial [Panacibacter sp.]|nr:sialate O-acetylesterase [Panacibacter sp.]